MLGLEFPYVLYGEEIIRVFGALGGSVDHDRRRYEMAGRHL